MRPFEPKIDLTEIRIRVSLDKLMKAQW